MSTTEKRLYTRVTRRSLHRSRSVAVAVALVVAVVILAWIGTESVLAAISAPALLLSPSDAIAAIEAPGPIAAGVAAGLALLGVIFVILAVTPGRRARHELPDERMAVIVDDAVLAGALSKAAISESRLPATRVSTTVSRRVGAVSVVPTSGTLLNAPAITRAVGSVVESLSPRPALRVAVSVAERGVVGS
jgi:hypothetical protein